MGQAGLEASGDGRIMGVENSVQNNLVEVRGFAESDRGRFDEEILGGLALHHYPLSLP